MQKILYHGSSNIVDKPMHGYGKTYNDYGLGFYCAETLVSLSRVLSCRVEDLIEVV